MQQAIGNETARGIWKSRGYELVRSSRSLFHKKKMKKKKKRRRTSGLTSVAILAEGAHLLKSFICSSRVSC